MTYQINQIPSFPDKNRGIRDGNDSSRNHPAFQIPESEWDSRWALTGEVSSLKKQTEWRQNAVGVGNMKRNPSTDQWGWLPSVDGFHLMENGEERKMLQLQKKIWRWKSVANSRERKKLLMRTFVFFYLSFITFSIFNFSRFFSLHLLLAQRHAYTTPVLAPQSWKKEREKQKHYKTLYFLHRKKTFLMVSIFWRPPSSWRKK